MNCFSVDRNLSYEVKQVNLQNLNRMVHYCDNLTDCRRTLQLEYFAEHFTRDQCLANRASACDNCLKKDKYKIVDATNVSIQVASCVRDLCCGNNRFTLLHVVDVFKGSQSKKVIENNHQNTVYHGKLKEWNRADILRLLQRLVIDRYLKEDLIFFKDIPQAYLKIGPEIER